MDGCRRHRNLNSRGTTIKNILRVPFLFPLAQENTLMFFAPFCWTCLWPQTDFLGLTAVFLGAGRRKEEEGNSYSLPPWRHRRRSPSFQEVGSQNEWVAAAARERERSREKRMNEGWFFESPPLVRPFSLSVPICRERWALHELEEREIRQRLIGPTPLCKYSLCHYLMVQYSICFAPIRN